jgi:HD-GYP domain-containing protein (c-di-GMP phosphodiesterase class II)
MELLRMLGRAASVEEDRRFAMQERMLSLAQIARDMERTVATLTGAMETRDPYTDGHQRRVAQLAVAIGERGGLPTEPLRLLRLAATVHDIGKIAVPAEILSKPRRMSEAEYAVVKQHCRAGCDLLALADPPLEITDAVLRHRERLDGSGYPQGLKGDKIGALGRILAVADVVEAMASNRPYRPALGVEASLEEIRVGRGERYDPEACDACLRLFHEEGFVFDA